MAEPRQKKTIIFTIGRMNPPTGGHMKLIDTMINASLELPDDDLGRGIVYIILSHTEEFGKDTKNPLSCSKKKHYLTQGMIEHIKGARNVQVKLLCMDESLDPDCEALITIMKQLCNIIKTEQNITNMELMVGSDRQKEYSWIGKLLLRDYNIILNEDNLKYNSLLTRPDPSKETEDQKLARKLKEDEYIFTDTIIPLEDMSSTLIRKLVIQNSPKFLKLYHQLGLSEDNARELLQDIQSAFLKDKVIKETTKLPRVPKINPTTPMKSRKKQTPTKQRPTKQTPTKYKTLLPTKRGGEYRSSKNKRSKNKRSKNKRSKNKRTSKNKRYTKKITIL